MDMSGGNTTRDRAGFTGLVLQNWKMENLSRALGSLQLCSGLVRWEFSAGFGLVEARGRVGTWGGPRNGN